MVRARRETISISKCETRYCTNVAQKGGLCNSCASAKYRREHPVRYAYQNLKDNAKRRGKAFELTFDQFKEFALKTGYMKKKGIFAESWHIDRIDETKGYTIDNIQVLTNSGNVRKYLRYSWDELNRKMMFTTDVMRPVNQVEGVPF